MTLNEDRLERWRRRGLQVFIICGVTMVLFGFLVSGTETWKVVVRVALLVLAMLGAVVHGYAVLRQLWYGRR